MAAAQGRISVLEEKVCGCVGPEMLRIKPEREAAAALRDGGARGRDVTGK
jgi:hypothetical protein